MAFLPVPSTNAERTLRDDLGPSAYLGALFLVSNSTISELVSFGGKGPGADNHSRERAEHISGHGITWEQRGVMKQWHVRDGERCKNLGIGERAVSIGYESQTIQSVVESITFT